jgi:hypothetical protein
MSRIFSNGPTKDFVLNPFRTMVQASQNLWIAAPYVSKTDELVEAANKGKSVCLLVGLNACTAPEALSAVFDLASCEIRYFTRRFHAKIYLFDNSALIGSSNLTLSGMQLNREGTMIVDEQDDLDEVRSLFNELWNAASILTSETLEVFTLKYNAIARNKPDIDGLLESAVGKAEPANANVGSAKKSAKGAFHEELRRTVHQYRNSFNEVTKIIEENQLRRAELEDIGIANETNRFVNWVRLTYAIGKESWQDAPFQSVDDRRSLILKLGKEWKQASKSQVPDDYIDWLRTVQKTFGTRDAIDNASQSQLSEGLMCLHAFHEQKRFTSGGAINLASTFWDENEGKVDIVRTRLKYLLFGGGEFISRLHDVLYKPERKIRNFGRFCSLELFGTIKPSEFPPVNGRIAKGLRFLGFNVPGD